LSPSHTEMTTSQSVPLEQQVLRRGKVKYQDFLSPPKLMEKNMSRK
jgi:hypothetical protein